MEFVIETETKCTTSLSLKASVFSNFPLYGLTLLKNIRIFKSFNASDNRHWALVFFNLFRIK